MCTRSGVSVRWGPRANIKPTNKEVCRQLVNQRNEQSTNQSYATAYVLSWFLQILFP